MIAEVISVGTELLLGHITDTNATVISQRLAASGFDAHFRVTVGDNDIRMQEVIRTACSRADVVIITGGIGPTPDDITRHVVAGLAGVALVRDEAHATLLHDRIMARRGIVLDNVLQMSDVPQGAEALDNANGAALGIAIDIDGARVFALPGVPAELELMLDTQVMPWLRESSHGAVVESVIVRTAGRGESEIAHLLDAMYTKTNPSLAFLIAGEEVHVRITSKAAGAHAAASMLQPVEAEVRRILGSAVVG